MYINNDIGWVGGARFVDAKCVGGGGKYHMLEVIVCFGFIQVRR